MTEPRPNALDALEPAGESLAAQIQSLRRWVVVLTVISLLALVSSCGVIMIGGVLPAAFLLSVLPSNDGADMSKQVADEVRRAYGDSLDTIDVRRVSIVYGETPLDSIGAEKGYAVRYRLKGAPVDVAGRLDGGTTIQDSGLLPPVGSLQSRLDATSTVALLNAWAVEHPGKPAGPIGAYTDAGSVEDMPTSAAKATTVAIEGKEYRVNELWIVSAGSTPKGDKVVVGETSPVAATSSVFRRDPKTGEFTFVGSDSTLSISPAWAD